VVAAYFYLSGGRYVSTEDAYVRSTVVSVAADVAGVAVAVPVADNQTVAAGDVLVRLDPEPFRMRLDEAEAQLGLVRQAIEAQRAQVRQLQIQLDQARNDIEFYQRGYDRQAQLAERGVAAETRLDEARHQLQAANAAAASLREQIQANLVELGGGLDVPVERLPRYRAALAARDEAAYDHAHATVRAPRAGVLGEVALQPGEYVAAGRPLFPLVATAEVWVEANLKETDLTHVRPGQPATVEVDTYPDRVWHAEVASISPATGAEFAVLPAQNASGNWVKVVQRVPVRLRIEPAADGDGDVLPLRAGLSVTATIDTGRKRSLPSPIASALALVNGTAAHE
jgi:membrane fusion protein (multidrug efflux system)